MKSIKKDIYNVKEEFLINTNVEDPCFKSIYTISCCISIPLIVFMAYMCCINWICGHNSFLSRSPQIARDRIPTIPPNV